MKLLYRDVYTLAQSGEKEKEKEGESERQVREKRHPASVVGLEIPDE